MQKDNSHIIGIITLACLLATAASSYLWGTVNNGTCSLFGFTSLLFGACFTYAAEKCISILAHRETDKG